METVFLVFSYCTEVDFLEFFFNKDVLETAPIDDSMGPGCLFPTEERAALHYFPIKYYSLFRTN